MTFLLCSLKQNFFFTFYKIIYTNESSHLMHMYKREKESESQSDAKVEIKRRMEEATAQNYFQNRRKDTVQQ